MGRISFQYVPPVGAAAAEWVRQSDFSFKLSYENAISLDVQTTGAFSDYTGQTVTTPANLNDRPVNHVAPTVSGPRSPGYALICDAGGWLSAWPEGTLQFLYQWYRDDTPIPGQTASTYTTSNDDLAAAITCRVRAQYTDPSASATLSEEVASSNTIDIRTEAWAAEAVGFGGGTNLRINEDFYVNEALTETDGTTYGAFNLIYFAHVFVPAGMTGSNINHIISQSTDSFLGVKGSSNEAFAGLEGEDDGLDLGGAPVSLSMTKGERMSLLFYGRQTTPGTVRGRLFLMDQAGVWTEGSNGRSGDLVATQFGIVRVGARADGSRWFPGAIYRAAAWANIDDLDLIPEAGDPTVLKNLFMTGGTTLVPPDVSQGVIGKPRFDFNTRAHFENASPEGTMQNWLLNGTLS